MNRPLCLVIATFNRANRLDRLLTELERQTLAQVDWEVIVCVDGSTDDTESVLNKHKESGKIPLRWFFQVNTGQAGARHRAILASDAAHIVVIDDDMELSPNFLEAHLSESKKDPGVGVIIGKVVPLPNWQQRPLFEAVREDFMMRLHRILEDNPELVPNSAALITQNVSFPRAMYISVGGFDEHFRLAEDTELGIRLERAGGSFRFSPSAWAIHRSDIGRYRTWADREYAYGSYLVKIWRKFQRDPLLHPLRNYVCGSVLNRLLVSVVVPLPGGVPSAELFFRFLGWLLRHFRCWESAIATHKAIGALLRHGGMSDEMGGWNKFCEEKKRFLNDPNAPKDAIFAGRTR